MAMMPAMTMLRLALTNLRVNKLRSALTVSGIVFGTGAVIATLSSNEGAAAYVRSEIKKLGTNVIYATRTGAQASRLSAVERQRAMSYLPDVKESALIYTLGSAAARAGANAATPPVLAVENGYFDVNALTFVKGRPFTRDEDRSREMVMALGSKASVDLFGQENPIGHYVHLMILDKPLTFRVIGVLKEKGGASAQNDSAVYLPLLLGPKLARQGALRSTLVAKLRNDEDSTKVKAGLKVLLSEGPGDDVNVSDAREALESTRKIWEKQNFVGIVLASISLVTGGVGIMNIMLLSITQRRREIGIRKSVGARTRQIFTQFLAESMLLCLLGGIVGILVGVLFGQKVASLMGQWDASISPAIVLMALGSACMTGLVFGMAPAMRASKLDPFEALRG